jgi:hypothetical protein
MSDLEPTGNGQLVVEAEGEMNLLPREIRVGLNEIRQTDLDFHEKAGKLAEVLQRADCEDIVVLECDVCVTDFYPEFDEVLSQLLPNVDDLSEEEWSEIYERTDSLIPDEARVRVQAETSAGYFTYCFGCESTMCMCEVRYPENTDWDQVHKEKAREILLLHPEWSVDKFHVSGSTRNRINIDVISSDPNMKYRQFDVDGFHVSVSALSNFILRKIPRIREIFEDLEPLQESITQ